MNDWLVLAISLILGAFLGGLFFGGLWLTLGWLNRVQHPGLLMLFSLLLRIALVVTGFGLMIRADGWRAAVAGIIGLLIVRMLLQKRLRPQPAEPVQ